MNNTQISNKLSELSLSMFRKDFFGLYHGSISVKTKSSCFLINKKDAIFDALTRNSLIELNYKKDYRWRDASNDSSIHLNIYKNITDAKYICFSMPPFTIAYSLEHSCITPKDYFGYKELGDIEIFDPKDFNDWYERADSEIYHYFLVKKINIMIIRGYGVYSFNRNLHLMIKKLAILEKSCRLLMLDSSQNDFNFD